MEIRKLEIRRLREEELSQALELVWEVFEKEIKPSYTEEGVQEFQKFIDHNQMRSLYTKGEIIFWGAFEEELIGTVAVRSDGHISLFFVKNEYQGLGVGKALFQMMYNYLVEELKVKKITVNAAPQSVAKYIHMGLRQMGNMEERNGICSVPMEMYASPTLVQPVKFRANKKKNHKKLKIAAAVVIVLLIAGTIFAGVRMAKNVYDFFMEEDRYEMPGANDFGGWNGDWNGDMGGSEEGTSIPGELSGVEAIEGYEAENLSYEITNDAYNFVDNETINMVIDFSVQFPKLTLKDGTSMDADVIDKVNQQIRDFAMETVDEIYTNPSDEIKERVIGAAQPVLVSYVTYRVTYQSDSFISIVMEDQSYKGTQEDYCYDFRTINISLTDGEICEVSDLVEINDDFVKEWLMIMRSEAENSKLLSELSKKELRKALEGESFDGVYNVEYFFDKEGIEIGFTFDYEAGDENDAGFAWVTAPFTYEEIKKFTTDSSIWHEMN